LWQLIKDNVYENNREHPTLNHQGRSQESLARDALCWVTRVKKMAADFRRNAQGKLIVTAVN